MAELFERLRQAGTGFGPRTALIDSQGSLSYKQLYRQVDSLAADITAAGARHIGLWLDNSSRWVIIQLAAFKAGIPVTAIPTFFSLVQQRHLCRQTGMDLLFAEHYQYALLLDHGFRPLPMTGAFKRDTTPARLPDGTGLLTFTSGTTGAPKGVCLGEKQLLRVCESLLQLTDDSLTHHSLIERHLCLMPLAVLLENLAGVLTPLLSGKTTLLLPASDTGLVGSSQLDTELFAKCINDQRPDSLILMPELLRVLTQLTAQGVIQHRSRFIAVGGGQVSPELLQQASDLGLPVYQGYGLSECASVVALNRPGGNRIGSVGQPLPHCQVMLAADGEVLVSGNAMLGYLGDNSPTAGHDTIATGDFGHFDSQGYLYIRGRKKNLFITSQGRNLSPEWVEAELTTLSAVSQACLYGDAQTCNTAIITPAADPETVTRQISQLNRRLPDYARIATWIPSRTPFSAHNQQLTTNGRLKRRHIHEAYATELRAQDTGEIPIKPAIHRIPIPEVHP